MKIENNSPEALGQNRQTVQNAQRPATAPAAQRANAPAASKPAAPADTVDISGQGRVAAEISAAAQQLPDVREARVQELKRSIDAGTYTVDARKVAESILKDL